jgi:glycosyltransferase involved in cell wall biosynthesis
MSERVCYQVNLQEDFGGGEVYTRFLTAALSELGWRSIIFTYRRADFWGGLDLRDATLVPVQTWAEIESRIAGTRPLVLTHTTMHAEDARRLARRTILCGMLHMPLYDRLPDGLAHYRLLFGVSTHVIASARSRGLANLHDEPLYGVADLRPRGATGDGAIREASCYEWDRRKFRDRLLGAFEPLWRALRPRREFRREPGLTLGIVSRITPIKQFPQMFEVLSPVIARHPRVRLEIFGSGGYASVRDLRRALEPIRSQVRFWGQQQDVVPVYREIDYLLSGLPEKEALGLNLIEAQSCGTPVLAVKAPPFTESVADGETGFLFDDPRGDAGRGFDALLGRLLAGAPRPDPARAVAHLEKFSRAAFRARLERALAAALA